MIIIAKSIGGQAVNSSSIKKYLGFSIISGFKLMQKLEEHLNKFNVELKESEIDSIIGGWNSLTQGLFAAGNATNVINKQTIIAAGERIKAALSEFRFLAKSK